MTCTFMADAPSAQNHESCNGCNNDQKDQYRYPPYRLRKDAWEVMVGNVEMIW